MTFSNQLEVQPRPRAQTPAKAEAVDQGTGKGEEEEAITMGARGSVATVVRLSTSSANAQSLH
jgi:hypothetical protein